MQMKLFVFVVCGLLIVANTFTYVFAEGNDCAVKHCEKCTEDNHKCAKCEWGFYPSAYGYWCDPLFVDHCKTYKPEGIICTACIDGYRLTDKNSCEKCSVEHCVNCDYEATWCHICEPGYLYASPTKCEKAACRVENCELCDASNWDKCVKCNKEYHINADGKCDYV